MVYSRVTTGPYRIPVTGPSTLVLVFRLRLPQAGIGPSPTAMVVSLDGRALGRYSLSLPRDAGAACREDKGFIASVPRSVRLTVPPGRHTYEVTMTGLGGAIRAEVMPTQGAIPLPPAPMSAVGEGPERVFGVSPTLSFGYDSNIIQLSPSDLDLIRTNRGYAPNGGLPRFGIESVDDVPVVLGLRGNALGRPWGGRKTIAELLGHAFFYPRNTIKWYGDAGIALSQEFTPGPEARISYTYQTPTYLRNLSYFDPTVPGTSFSFVTYRKAWFQSHTGGILVSQPVTEIFRIAVGYGFESLLFRDVFSERDSYIHRGIGGFTVTPWGPLDIRLGGSYERSLARGDIPSTPRIEADTSYALTTGDAGLAVDMEKAGWVNLLLDITGSVGFKYFTTGNAQDPTHYHREDVINVLGGKLRYRVGKRWALGVSYTYTLVNSNAKAPTPEQLDEATSYREDVVSLFVTFVSPSFGPPVGLK